MAETVALSSPLTLIEIVSIGTQGPPGVVFLAALPFIDAAGSTHKIRISSDAMIPFFDSLGAFSPIHLSTVPA